MINIDIKNDYSKKLALKDIVKDIRDYGITNIRQDDDNESLYVLADTLLGDYNMRRANYKAYITRGIDARVLMELRKSAVLPFEVLSPAIFEAHNGVYTVEGIKEIRKAYFQTINQDYRDEDWQYFLLVRKYLNERSDMFFCDFEDCYADGDPSKVRGIPDYIEDFVDAHLEGYPGYVSYAEKRKQAEEFDYLAAVKEKWKKEGYDPYGKSKRWRR